MRYLLDTNAWLWMTGASATLGERTRALLENATNDLYLSVASAWEIVIKTQLGKLQVVGEPGDFIRSRIRLQRVTALPITLDHTLAVSGLAPHHRDPFDRIIIGQALAENLILITADRRLAEYPVTIVDARA